MPQTKLRAIQDLAGWKLPTAFTEGALRVTPPALMKYPARQLRAILSALPFPEKERLVLEAVEYSYQARHHDSQKALQVALQAAVAARHIAEGDKPFGGQRAIATLFLANAYCWTGSPASARRCFTLGKHLLADLSEQGALPALVSYLEGAFLGEYRHFDEALSRLDEAARLYVKAGLPRVAGQVHVSMARIYAVLGSTKKALTEITRASPLVVATRDPTLLLIVEHMFVTFLAELGEVGRACAYFSSLERLYHELGEDLLILRGAWLKGRLSLAAGQPVAAATALTAVRDAFRERGLAYDAALAGLDLARALARQGLHDDVRRLAEDMVPVFQDHGIEREARQALLQWVDAVRRGEESEAGVHRTVESLREVARTPRPLDP